MPISKNMVEMVKSVVMALAQRWKARLEDARKAESLGRDDEAEKILWELSGPPYSESLNRDIYPILIDYYASRGQRVKLIEIYEQFSSSYPQDPELPEVFFRLGNLYRIWCLRVGSKSLL